MRAVLCGMKFWIASTSEVLNLVQSCFSLLFFQFSRQGVHCPLESLPISLVVEWDGPCRLFLLPAVNDEFSADSIMVGDSWEYPDAGYELSGVGDDRIQCVVKACWFLHHLLKAEILEDVDKVGVKSGASRLRLQSSVARPTLES